MPKNNVTNVRNANLIRIFVNMCAFVDWAILISTKRGTNALTNHMNWALQINRENYVKRLCDDGFGRCHIFLSSKESHYIIYGR